MSVLGRCLLGVLGHVLLHGVLVRDGALGHGLLGPLHSGQLADHLGKHLGGLLGSGLVGGVHHPLGLFRRPSWCKGGGCQV